VLVCGSNYGAAYVRALAEKPDAYQLAGLLARGSPRSRRVAQKHHVGLYSTVAELPADIDIACAAMGSPAADVVLNLIGRGIHVLLEHPVRPGDLERAAADAAQHQVRMHVQTLFPSLDAPRTFIDDCKARSSKDSCALIELLVTDRALYASLDTLRQAFRSLEPFACAASPSGEGDPFDTVRGTCRGIPLVVRVQRSRRPNGRLLSDGSSEYLVDCRISAWFGDGVLTLLSVAGPVIWNAGYRRQVQGGDPAWLSLGATSTSATFGDLMKQQTRANLQAIEALSTHAAGGPQPDVQDLSHLLEVSRIWERIGHVLGRNGAAAGD
jgi:thiazolinyl imide reductase